MESTRQLKVAKLLQKELSDVFLKYGKEIVGKAFVTVTHVQVSPDLSFAKVFLSIFMIDDKDALLLHIGENAKFFRTHLAQKIRKQVRIIPEIAFFPDNSADYASHMDQVISKLNIKPEQE